MNFYIDRLNNELRNILNFWYKHVFHDQYIASEVYSGGTINKSAPTGSLFLSKILYGVSAASRHLNENQYIPLADKAYIDLTTTFKNPKGGFYWAINNSGKIIHDELNVSYAQIFIAYGLIEYYALTANEQIKELLTEQISFIESILIDKEDGSLMDGFHPDWKPSISQSKSLGTHLHMLETYIKLSEVIQDGSCNTKIENLLELILTHFINSKTCEVIHNFDNQWNAMPTENRIGHNMELSWSICRAARSIRNEELYKKCSQTAIEICNKAIELAFDKQYGGMFNRFDKKELIVTDKEWWTQAESVIGFLNAYTLTTDKKYLSYAIRLLEYIDNIFSDAIDGEWYDSVSRDGTPYLDKPKVHLWKSLYHNVLYCLETSNYLQKLYVRAGEKV
jgi:mannobiose 2-epimerase